MKAKVGVETVRTPSAGCTSDLVRCRGQAMTKIAEASVCGIPCGHVLKSAGRRDEAVG